MMNYSWLTNVASWCYRCMATQTPMDSTKKQDINGGMSNKTNLTDILYRPNFADSSDSQTINKYGLLACDYDIY